VTSERRRLAWAIAVCASLLIVPLLALLLSPRPDLAARAAGSVDTSLPSSGGDASSAPSGRIEVKGAVKADDGEPLQGVRVVAWRSERSVGSVTTKADGSFTLRVPAGGPIELVATKAGHREAKAAVDLDAGEVVALVLSRALALSGTVTTRDGTAVAGAMVVCDTRNQETAITDQNGRFTLPSDADGCTASANHDGQVSAPKVLTGGGNNVLVLEGPGSIAGKVELEDGAPLRSYRVGVESFVGADGSRQLKIGKSAQVDDPDGAFRLEGLAPGTYVLVVTSPGKPPSKSREVVLDAGEALRGVLIRVSSGASVSGIVTSRRTGSPVARASVRLDAASSSGATFLPSMTDEEGRFVLSGAPREPFSLRVSHPEFKDRIVSVDGANPSELSIDLADKGDGTDMEMSGIGATLRQGQRFVEVATVLSGGPAEAEGMQPGDRIERIEGRDAAAFSVSDCVQRLRGPEGTRVRVTVGRGDVQRELTITRKRIER
jgi:hypothetical protein